MKYSLRLLCFRVACLILVLPMTACFIISDVSLIKQEIAAQPFSEPFYLVPLKIKDNKMTRDEDSSIVQLVPDEWRYRRIDIDKSSNLEEKGYVTFVKTPNKVDQNEIYFVELYYEKHYIFGFSWKHEVGGRDFATFTTIVSKSRLDRYFREKDLNISQFPFLEEKDDQYVTALSIEGQGLPELLGKLYEKPNKSDTFTMYFEIKLGIFPGIDIPSYESMISTASSMKNEGHRQENNCNVAKEICGRGCIPKSDGTMIYNTRDGKYWFREDGRRLPKEEAPEFGCPQ